MTEVTIEGKKYPVKFGFSVVKNFAVKKGMQDLESFEKWYTTLQAKGILAIGEMAELVLMGIQRGCRKQKVECSLDEDDVVDLIGEDRKTFELLISLISQEMEHEEMKEIPENDTQVEKKN